MASLFTFSGFLLVAGYLGLFAGVFVETGLLIGLIVPGGETLVFTAGFLSSIGYFNIWAVVAVTLAAAVLADSVEYAFGRKYGPKIFDKPDSRFFKKEYVGETKRFFERHGGKTIILARFVPFVRTLAPAFAGVGEMPYASFLGYNLVGGLVWSAGIALLGYFLGSIFPGAEQYAILVIGLIALVSLASPFAFAWYHKRRK